MLLSGHCYIWLGPKAHRYEGLVHRMPSPTPTHPLVLPADEAEDATAGVALSDLETTLRSYAKPFKRGQVSRHGSGPWSREGGPGQ